MRIGELARRLNLSTSRIRFYEAHGLLAKPGRSDNGYRDYPDSAVETLRLIDGAQSLGFSLSEIRAGLAQAGAAPPSKGAMLNALRYKLASLDQHIHEVTLRRRRIVTFIEQLEDKCSRPQSGLPAVQPCGSDRDRREQLTAKSSAASVSREDSIACRATTTSRP